MANKKCYWCPSCGNKLNTSMFCSFCCSTWATLPRVEDSQESKKDANYFIDQAKKHMSDRAESYDNESGERSMLSTIRAFSDITGICMTEEHGWLFMGVLKMVRSQQGKFKSDNYEDGCAYFGLAGEAAAKNRI